MRSDHLKKHYDVCKGDRADIISEYSDASSRRNDFDHVEQEEQEKEEFKQPRPKMLICLGKRLRGEVSDDDLSTINSKRSKIDQEELI